MSGVSEAGDGGGEDTHRKRSDEGHPPGVAPRKVVESSATGALAHRGAYVGGSPQAFPEAAQSRTVRRPDFVGRAAQRAANGDCQNRLAGAGRGRSSRGARGRATGASNTRCVVELSASPQSSRSLCREGDGNIAASDSMWQFGCVQPALAELRMEPVIRHRGHREGPASGRGELRLASSVAGFDRPVAHASSMLGRCRGGNTPAAPSFYAGT